MAFSIVQSQHGSGTTTTASISCTATTAGHLLVAIIAAAKNPGAVTFTAPAGWVQAGTTLDDNNFIEMSAGIFYLPNCPGGSTSFAWTLSSAPSQWDGILLEISGAATSTPLDVSNATNALVSHASDTVSITTTASGDLVLGFGVWDVARTGVAPTITDGGSFASVHTFSDVGGWMTVHAAQQTQTSSGSISYAPSWTGGSTDDIIWAVAFKASASTALYVPHQTKYTGRGVESTLVTNAARWYIGRGLSSTLVAHYITRGLSSTIVTPIIRAALAAECDGVGTLSETFTLATALSDTIPGVGTLTPTLSANTALSATMAGVGTLAAAFTITGGVTSLTVYPNAAAASAVLSTANQLVGNATTATNAAVPKTNVNASTDFGEVCSQTQTGAWLGHVGAITDAACNPTGHGWFLDASTLDLQDIVAGNWTPKFRHVTSANSYTCDMYCRAFVYNAGTYTLIGTAVLSAQTVSSTIANYTWAAASLPLASFPTGSHLYIDLWHNILTTTCVSGNTVQVNQSSIAGDGLVNVNVATPGYQPTASGAALSVTLAGVGTLAGTFQLSTALTDTLAGVGTLTGTLTEKTALGATFAGVGKLLTAEAYGASAAIYGGAIYGTAPMPPFSLMTALTHTVAGVGLLSATLSTSGNVALGTTIPGVGTLSGTMGLATALTDTIPGVGVLTGTMAAKTALTCTIPGVGTLSPTLSATTALSRTLAGVGTLSPTLAATTALATTIAGVGTLTGTLTESTALTTTFAGVGALSGTFSLATSLTVTIVGVGQLLPTLSTTGGVSLTCTIPGVGTITGTTSLKTALSTTIAGVGTLTPSLSANLTLASVTMAGVGTVTGTANLTTALSTTIAGTGTLSGTTSLKTALTTTMAGVGTLTGTLSVSGQAALLVTMSGVGTLAGTLIAQTALTATMAGTGTLSGIFSLRVALSLTFAGAGTLAGHVSIPILSYLTATWVTRDMAVTWVTRDGKIIWNTRDEQAAWDTRDEQATWNTRDELVTWKGRG